MTEFIIALIVVGGMRSFAFRGTTPEAFKGDIGLLVILTIAFNVMF
ncbi:hypothetical protein CA51_13530 [Rosistilla oblonga]|nr:hypothetical protein [Rosistilla oblonga]QDV11489.1 hypothetical protein CA51_13530 [Rosistilla oblonga]